MHSFPHIPLQLPGCDLAHLKTTIVVVVVCADRSLLLNLVLDLTPLARPAAAFHTFFGPGGRGELCFCSPSVPARQDSVASRDMFEAVHIATRQLTQ